MNKKLWITGLLTIGMSLSMLTGCGSELTEKKEDVTQGAKELKKDAKTNEPKGIVAGNVVSSFEDLGDGKFEYKVKNQTEKEMKFDFTSSQRYDYAIRDKEGKQVYLLSSLSMYMQQIGEETLKQGEELTYAFDLNETGLNEGEYSVEVWLTPKDGKSFQVSFPYHVK